MPYQEIDSFETSGGARDRNTDLSNKLGSDWKAKPIARIDLEVDADEQLWWVAYKNE